MRFRLLWADVADEVCVSYLSTFWDFGLFDEEYGAGACACDAFNEGTTHSDAVGEQSTPFVCKAAFPDGGVRAAEELFTGSLFSGCWWRGG